MNLPASAESTPITYADAKGQQYIAVVATGGLGIGAALSSDSLVVFSLTGTSTETLSQPLKKHRALRPQMSLHLPPPLWARISCRPDRAMM